MDQIICESFIYTSKRTLSVDRGNKSITGPLQGNGNSERYRDLCGKACAHLPTRVSTWERTTNNLEIDGLVSYSALIDKIEVISGVR